MNDLSCSIYWQGLFTTNITTLGDKNDGQSKLTSWLTMTGHQSTIYDTIGVSVNDKDHL